MNSNKWRRRIALLGALLGNPRSLTQGGLGYLYNNGLIGKLPTKYAFSLYKEQEVDIRLEQLPTISGGATITELSTIAYLCRLHAPKTIFEIGTLEGRTTLNMALNSPEDCRIYTLDLPLDQRRAYYKKRLGEIKVWTRDEPPPFLSAVGECFNRHPAAQKITQLYGDTRNFDFTPFHGKMDFVFIDANHEYEFVKSDTEQALKMISSRGMIVWHDYPNVRGVMEFLDELYQCGEPLIHLWDTRLALYSKPSEHDQLRVS